jgi:hypothetical protein
MVLIPLPPAKRGLGAALGIEWTETGAADELDHSRMAGSFALPGSGTPD